MTHQIRSTVTSVQTVASEDIEVDLEEGLLAATSDGLHYEDFRQFVVVVYDQVRNRFPLQNASFAVECGSERGRFKFESEIKTFEQYCILNKAFLGIKANSEPFLFRSKKIKIEHGRQSWKYL